MPYTSHTYTLIVYVAVHGIVTSFLKTNAPVFLPKHNSVSLKLNHILVYIYRQLSEAIDIITELVVIPAEYLGMGYR